ncbi:hypothetical protein [Paraburkholderia sp. IW21]
MRTSTRRARGSSCSSSNASAGDIAPA